MSGNNLSTARLVYLAIEHQPALPPLKILNRLPYADILKAASKGGYSAVLSEVTVSEEQIENLYMLGSKPTRGNEDEFRHLLADVLTESLEFEKDEMGLTTWVSTISQINEYVQGKLDTSLITVSEMSLSDESEIADIVKWPSGFTPLDLLFDQFYQGICTVMARPGTGKTSIMLSLMESLRRTSVSSSLWFFELEMPLGVMMFRTKAMRQRTPFLPEDKFICGIRTMSEIIERVESNPDPNRVIFLDSPDVMAGGTEDTRRFAIEQIYRDLLRIKERCKLIVVASQPRRQDTELSMASVAEAWQKAHYTDMLVGISQLPGMNNGQHSMLRLKNLKNRLGVSNNEVRFMYNYADLSWLAPETVGSEDTEDW